MSNILHKNSYLIINVMVNKYLKFILTVELTQIYTPFSTPLWLLD